ncbi:MAG: Mut7-C ubiquitin/RNAse domain-containing protein [Acidobacteriia bacterium]|nr:Mut7-C ubiquitin/RNAse domain-containing protein [Terriglobia bacterium]
MELAYLRFYEELNEYLPEDKRKRSFICRFSGEVTVARLLQVVGIPLREVDLIMCEGESVNGTHVVRNGDRIGFYPVFESFDIKGVTRMREEPLRRPRFVTGPGLGRLAAYLRMLGFDTRCGAHCSPGETAAWAEAERRILLTAGSLPPQSSRAIIVRGSKPRQQASEVIARLDLYRLIMPLGLCPRCNSRLTEADGPPHCATCGRIYRNGIHLRRVCWLISRLSRRESV